MKNNTPWWMGWKLHREEGFTLVELAIVLIIFALIVSIAALNYGNISNGINMTAGRRQVEAALNRAKTAARQENVTYQIIFYTEAAGHPNSYEFLHDVYDVSTDTWTMTPVDRSVSGEDVISEGGHTYITISNGVRVTGSNEISGSEIVVSFIPSGTTMAIVGSDNPGGGIPPTTSETVTINLASGGRTGSVSINGMGTITVD